MQGANPCQASLHRIKGEIMKDSHGNPTTPSSGDIDLDENGVNDWEEYGEEWVLMELSLSRKT